MFKQFAVIAVLGILAGCCTKKSSNMASSNGQNGAAPISDQDRMFVHNAAIAGIGEVQAGQLAATRSNDPQVQQFGKRMVEDHTKANDALKQIAMQQGIEVPTELDADSQMEADQLQKMTGNDFDKLYIQDQVNDHNKVIDMFQTEAEQGQDPQLRDFAKNTLPTLQHHLQMAKSIQSSMMSGNKSSSGNGM